MSLEPSSKQHELSPINEAKSLLSNGDAEGALGVLKKAGDEGDVMGCFDGGFMMIQGIGCERDVKGGLELMKKGEELKEKMKDDDDDDDDWWKHDGSVTDVLDEQTMDLLGLLQFMIGYFC